MQYEKQVRADYCGFVLIAPAPRCGCVSMLPCLTSTPPLPEGCHKVEKVLKDDEGKEVGRESHSLERVGKGQGCPLTSYKPFNTYRNTLAKQTFTFVSDKEHSAVAEMKSLLMNREVFPPSMHGPQSDLGPRTWDWRGDLLSKQKPSDLNLFDPERSYIARGSHVPLMIFVGTHGEGVEVKRSNGVAMPLPTNEAGQGTATIPQKVMVEVKATPVVPGNNPRWRWPAQSRPAVAVANG